MFGFNGAEIEATLKRVNEGVAEWDALWDKLEETEVSAGSGRRAIGALHCVLV